MAAITVKMGRILSNKGRMIPIAPKISDIPIKRIKGGGKPTTPVCPFAINFCSERMDLFKPENINIIAIID
jgi:hypothetical protein